MRRLAIGLALGALVAACEDETSPSADVEDVGSIDLSDTDATDTTGDTDLGEDSRNDATEDPRDDDPEVFEPVAFASTPDTLAQANQPWTYAATTEPMIADIRLAIGPETATIDAATITWVPPARGLANAEFALDARVGDTTVASQTFTVEVNHPPEFLNTPPTSATVGQPWIYVPIANDEDEDLLMWSLESGPEWMTLQNDALSGVPTAAGESDFTVRVDDGRGGTTTLEGTLRVIESVRDLSASTHYLGNVEAALSLFGCCFDRAPDVYWGGIALDVTRVNAGRLDVSFPEPARPGDQPIQLLRDDVVIGELTRLVSVIPEPILVEGAPTIIGDLGGARVRVLGWDGEVLETAALGADVDSWSSSSMGVIFVEVDGVGSEPLVVPGGDELLVVAIEPQLHEVGSIVEFVFSRPTSDPLEARWADVSATCFSTDPSRCRATVPIGASGFVEVVADGVTLPSIASGISGSPTSIASGPWINWANRRSLRSGVPTLVVISTLGGAPTAIGADLELIELTQTRAVISLIADGETATIRVRNDEWSFAVE